MKLLFFMYSCLVCLAGRSQILPENKFTLNGKILDRDTGYIILRYRNSNEKLVRDTAFLKNGKFYFEGEINEPVFANLLGYRKMINYENVNSIDIFLEPKSQKIELHENEYANAKMEGSVTQKEYDTLQSHLNSIKTKYKSLYLQIGLANESYSIANTQKEKEIVQQKADELIGQLQPERDEIKQAIISFVLNYSNSYVSPYFFYSCAKTLPVDSAKKIFQSLTPKMQNSINGKFIAELFSQYEKNAVGNTPHNFNAKDFKGRNISLFKFSGKFLYMDFWASWCAPCREQIPNLKKLFKIYHLKGLEILTVSIDKDSTSWIKAVQFENLSKWYNVIANKEIEDHYENVNNPIPSGMLIAPNGKIVWKTGTPETLEAALIRLIK